MTLVMDRPAESGEDRSAARRSRTLREALTAAPSAAMAAAAGDSIYVQKLTANPPVPRYDLVPHTVYFYYVRLDSDGRLRVRHYTRSSATPIPHASLQQVVQEMVDNVRNGDPAWQSDGKNFENIVWTRKSYIAFFVDESNWDLHENGAAKEGIRFVASPTPNHTFYDAVDLKATVVNRRSGVITQRSAIAFVNHMKENAQGDDIGTTQPSQTFKFEMIFDVKFADLSTAPLIAIFDPDGTNLGPPIGPPP